MRIHTENGDTDDAKLASSEPKNAISNLPDAVLAVLAKHGLLDAAGVSAAADNDDDDDDDEAAQGTLWRAVASTAAAYSYARSNVAVPLQPSQVTATWPRNSA